MSRYMYAELISVQDAYYSIEVFYHTAVEKFRVTLSVRITGLVRMYYIDSFKQWHMKGDNVQNISVYYNNFPALQYHSSNKYPILSYLYSETYTQNDEN
jgi:hypothetical protein